MKIKQVLSWIWSTENKAGVILVSLVAMLLLYWGIESVFFPRIVTEEDISSPRVLAVRAVCKEIPVMDGFTKINHSWGERVGGAAHYSNTYKTSASFQEVHDFYVPLLREKGFNGGGWYQSVREKQISFGKNKVGVTISYNTEVWRFNLWEWLFSEPWNVYIWCDDREAYKKK